MIIDPKTNQIVTVKKPEAKSVASERTAASETAAPVERPAVQPGGDKVNLSDRSKLIAKARELADLAPDVRAEKVADLTARIAAGTYKVGSETVADSIVRKRFSSLV
jgi:negative regulator of flagellin synthesis FlgM